MWRGEKDRERHQNYIYEKIRPDSIHGFFAALQFRIFCLTIYYVKTERLKYACCFVWVTRHHGIIEIDHT
jgi:hypothetical protein